MAINGINGSGFNPYARSVGTAATVRPASDPATASTESTATASATRKTIADAIKSDANARAAQIGSPQAPEGVDQDFWSVLTKEERTFFVKAGAMGPLTYGRFTPTNAAPAAPIVRGGRVDIRA